jgi:YidC/Oxa1 family membrane protein insertase
MLIAIALSVLIMIVWMQFFAPEPPRVTEQTQDAIERIYEAEQPAGLEPEAPIAERVKPDELAKAQDVLVQTTHISATFTTLGARLVSLSLPEYQSKRGGQVELVPNVEDMSWPLGLRFNDEDFGTRTEDFIYDYTLYDSTSAELSDISQTLKLCPENSAGKSEDEIWRQLDSCLQNAGDQTLRPVVLGLVSRRLASGQSASSLAAQAEELSKSQVLVFSYRLTPQIDIIKAFVFAPEKYSFDMITAFRNLGDRTIQLGGNQPSYWISWVPGMESSETSPKYDELVGVHLVQRNFGQKSIRKLKEAKEFAEDLTWIGLKRKYFFVAFEPGSGLAAASMNPLGEKEELVRISLAMAPMTIEPGQAAANHVRICVGPMLKHVLESCGPGFDQILNFGFFDYFGKILLAGLLFFNKYVQNYGLAIILLTIVVRVALFPLNQKSYKSMKEMQALQPKVAELREKYKKNPQEMNRKMMELYRTHKVNPMGGCLPIAFQMPVFIALFQALRYAVELRGAQFLWITDLSEPDRLFTLTVPFNLPINLLPLLVIGAMVIQQKMTPVAGAQNEAQQKMMQYMPIIFGFLFYSMPSGLTVYFLVSTVLGLVQQYFVQKAA